MTVMIKFLLLATILYAVIMHDTDTVGNVIAIYITSLL